MSGQGHATFTGSCTNSAPAVSTPAPARDERQDQLGNGEVQRQAVGGTVGAPPAGAGASDEVRLPGKVAADGNLSYYRRRHGDFASRYQDAGLKPPNYYLGYGEKYVGRFTNETNQRLTDEGKAWLVRARVNLQRAIEGRRDADPADFDTLEKNDAAFTSFAYGTHADAYWNAGLGDLGAFDLANIGMTPDMRDLLAWDGLTQVADIGSRLLSTWGEDAIDYVAGDGTTDELVDVAYEGFSVVGDGIDEVFGQGTAHSLTEGAARIGHGAVDLAEDAHGYAAAAVGEGVDAVDSVMGDGWTESTVDSARETASDLSDSAEAGLGSAKDWARGVWDDIL